MVLAEGRYCFQDFDKVYIVCGKNLWKNNYIFLQKVCISKIIFLKHTTFFVSTSFHICTIHLIQYFHFLNQQWLIEWNQSVSPVSEIMYTKCMKKETEALRLSTRYRHVLQTKLFMIWKYINCYRCVYCRQNWILQNILNLLSFQSLGSDPLASHEVAKLPFNRAKNRFANIFPCKHFDLLCVFKINSLLWCSEEAD